VIVLGDESGYHFDTGTAILPGASCMRDGAGSTSGAHKNGA
jgi:hypothetical protein